MGQSLGAYTILAKLGAGGMGEVYRARDTKVNRDVAGVTALVMVLVEGEDLSQGISWRASDRGRRFEE